jgi:integrase
MSEAQPTIDTVKDEIPADLSAPREPAAALLTVIETATLLNVSESWVRRHAHELPCVRLGGHLRFDRALLLRQIERKLSSGSPLKPERGSAMIQPRRYQQGYVFKTGKKVKTWYGMYREDVRRADGTLMRRQRKVRLGTLAELPTKSAAAARISELLADNEPTLEMYFSDLVQNWKEAVIPTLKPESARYYEKLLRLHVVPEFDTMQVAAITRHHVRTFLAGKVPLGYSRSTMKGMLTSLSSVLEYAVDCDVLDKNPCGGVKIPRSLQAAKKRRVLTPKEVTQIASKLKEPYATLFLFLAVTGLRVGEGCAVRWSAIDADGVLHVLEKVYEGKIGSVKTESSERSLPLPEALLARLRTLEGGEWVFSSRNATPMNAGNALKRQIHPVAKSLGIELTGWHDLRHTATTKMIRDGHSPNTVSQIMGHSSPKITLGIYDHPELEDFRAPLNGLSDQLLRDVTKSASSA